MNRIGIKIRTAIALGWKNVLRLLVYRVAIRLGIHPVQRLQGQAPTGIFFREIKGGDGHLTTSCQWQKTFSYFGWLEVDLQGQLPNWHRSPLTGNNADFANLPWWKIPDFAEIGDIKEFWEASRFSWVLACAQRIRGGDQNSLQQLNAWLQDWSIQNPPYYGVNWKCGQEAGMRVLHLAISAILLGQVKETEEALLALVELHLQRIAPTLSYAIAQDNNHGTSEAAALFVGGNWLLAHGKQYAERWATLGRHGLENRVQRLVAVDGSFSQYSVTYHRVLLDTLNMVEVWRRYLQLPPFSAACLLRARAAAYWLFSLTDAQTGDAPNLGANDGALLLPLVDVDYRDFRPTVQLSVALFADRCAYGQAGPWDLALHWLAVPKPGTVIEPACSRLFDDGGYAVLKRGKRMALLRYPRFRFRPSHADALHLDFWKDGFNLLRDAGTYSYHANPEEMRYFPGTRSHNTIEFDGRDQMPRLSRFLFGAWLKTKQISNLIEDADKTHVTAAYQDGEGAQHQRSVTLSDHSLLIEDQISNFQHAAILRWRLLPGCWKVEGRYVTNGEHILEIKANMPITRLALVSGLESRYYLKKEEVPVLEVEVHQAGTLLTELRWA